MELYPYLADLRDSMEAVIEYIRYLRCRSSVVESFDGLVGNKLNKKQFKIELYGDEHEPWVHLGGLMGDIHRLIF